jgi:hypothetical protein
MLVRCSKASIAVMSNGRLKSATERSKKSAAECERGDTTFFLRVIHDEDRPDRFPIARNLETPHHRQQLRVSDKSPIADTTTQVLRNRGEKLG